jgi:hypothetical protein
LQGNLAARLRGYMAAEILVFGVHILRYNNCKKKRARARC